MAGMAACMMGLHPVSGEGNGAAPAHHELMPPAEIKAPLLQGEILPSDALASVFARSETTCLFNVGRFVVETWSFEIASPDRSPTQLSRTRARNSTRQGLSAAGLPGVT
jgi:hypothetical protein